MAKNKKPADAAKDKAAKQKKIAIGLVCFLALAVAYAAHTMMSLNSSGGTKPVAASETTPATTTPATPTPAPTAAAPTLGGAPVATDPAAASTGSGQLLAAVSPPADPGQLESFSHFESKDPFAGGGPSSSSPSSSGGSSGSGTGSSGSGSSGSGTSSPPATPPAPPTPPPTTAVIAVNGVSESVTTGAIFPTTSPNATSNGVFDLVSLTSNTATVSVVGGSYASGSQTLKLTANKPVTLVNTADGTRYTLLLYPQGTAAPVSGAAGSSGSSGSSGTTPAVTTTTPTPPTTTTTPSGP
jgi:uncharacterized membrane protein YgcG